MSARGALLWMVAPLAASALTAMSTAQTTSPAPQPEAVESAPDALDAGAAMTRKAEATLAGLSVDGGDIAVLFGVPTRQQEQRARAAATSAFDLTTRADRALTDAIDRLAADASFADNRALQDRRSELDVEYRLSRLPLARARAAALLARLADSPSLAGRFADETIEALGRFEAESSVANAALLTLTAAATLARGDRLNDTLVEKLVNAGSAESLTSLRAHAPRLAREIVAGAVVALAQSRRYDRAVLLANQGFPSASRDPSNLDAMARRDAKAMIALARSRQATSREDRAAALRSAIDALVSGGATNSRALLELALRKVERITPISAALTELPPAGQIAQGRRQQRAGDNDAAIASFAAAWEQLDESQRELREISGWSLSRALRQREQGADDIAQAGNILLTLARTGVTFSSADKALRSSVALLEWAHAAAARANNPALAAQTKQSLASALRLALRRAPAAKAADNWRLLLSGLGAGDDRRRLLESISPGGASYARARLTLAWLTFDELGKAPSDAQRDAIAFQMLQYTKQASGSIGEDAKPELSSSLFGARAVALAQLRRFDEAVAAALRWDDADGAGEPDAIEYTRRRASKALRDALIVNDADRASTIAAALAKLALRSLERASRDTKNQSQIDAAVVDLADGLFESGGADQIAAAVKPWADRFGVTRGVGIALAMGLDAQGDDERAFSILRDVVDASRVLDVRDEFFWRAWVGMMKILSERNDDGSRSEAILLQIGRLGEQDGDLGDALTKRRLEAIKRAARSRLRK